MSAEAQTTFGIAIGVRKAARVAIYDKHMLFLEEVADFDSFDAARAAIRAANATISAFMTSEGRLPA